MTAQKRVDRFWSRVDKSGSCWLWAGAKNSAGYGRFAFIPGGKRFAAHRVAYALSGKELRDSQSLDHLCRNRACCNPAHLEIVTNRENILRGVGPSAKNAAKTHCPKGHEFTAENTMLVRSEYGHANRKCRICERAKNRAFHAANRERQNEVRKRNRRLAELG